MTPLTVFAISGVIFCNNYKNLSVIAAGVPCKVIREITEADNTGWRPNVICY